MTEQRPGDHRREAAPLLSPGEIHDASVQKAKGLMGKLLAPTERPKLQQGVLLVHAVIWGVL